MNSTVAFLGNLHKLLHADRDAAKVAAYDIAGDLLSRVNESSGAEARESLDDLAKGLMALRRRSRYSQKLTLHLPPEFIERCKADGVAPETVLRGFVADLAGIMNWASSPREDGYNSNGADERELALQYYQRVGYPYWKDYGIKE